MKVSRNYGNGFAVEVEGDTMVEVLENLAQMDEVFFDTRAFGRDQDGNIITSDKIRFQVRHTKTQDGRNCTYHEQVCAEGPLKFYKRSIGEFQDRKGEVFVKKGPPKNGWPQNTVPGLAGWHKYEGQPQQQYVQQGGQQPNGQYAAPQAPQGYSPPQQQAPQQGYAPTPQQRQAPQQQQFNPHTAPPQYGNYQPADLEEVPF